jgi:hypothetical protein
MEPTGWAADDRTFFYSDTVAGVARAAWRDPSGTYVLQRDIGTGPENVVPSGTCANLYYSAPGSANIDIFVAPFN